MTSRCPAGHTLHWACHKGSPATCTKCERDKKLAKQKQQEELDAQLRRDAEQKAHLAKMDALNAQIEDEKRKAEDARLSQEQVNALLQKKKDLASMKAANLNPVASPLPSPTSPFKFLLPSIPQTPQQPVQSATPSVNQAAPAENGLSAGSSKALPTVPTLNPANDRTNSTIPASGGKPFKDPGESPSQVEWNRQKTMEGVQNDAIDAIMGMIGLEAVKQGVLDIKAKIDVNVRQGSSLKRERFNAVLLGSPGTGMSLFPSSLAAHFD